MISINPTIMLPVHRSNIPFANECIKHLLTVCDYNIIVIDDFGKDDEYISDNRISFIHNSFQERQPLVKIWNQCIRECPTNNLIIASWRPRPEPKHFLEITYQLRERYGMVAFDGLHFFAFNKHLINRIGFFDEGFTKGQYEDTDWFNRLFAANIAVYTGKIEEDRQMNSMWLDGEANKQYYLSKWTEDAKNHKLIQHKEEVNFLQRETIMYPRIDYRPWSDSVLESNYNNYYSLFSKYEKS